jgi:hypothetical protein
MKIKQEKSSPRKRNDKDQGEEGDKPKQTRVKIATGTDEERHGEYLGDLNAGVDDSELWEAVFEGIARMAVTMKMDDGGRWRIQRQTEP